MKQHDATSWTQTLNEEKTIKTFKPFSTNFLIMDKPGSWFLVPKYLKNTCRRVKFQVKM